MTDLPAFLETTEMSRQANRNAEYGDPADPERRAFLTRISPLTNVGKLRIPVFIAAGAKDSRVPITQAEALVKALKANGTPVWYVRFEDAGHQQLTVPTNDFSITGHCSCRLPGELTTRPGGGLRVNSPGMCRLYSRLAVAVLLVGYPVAQRCPGTGRAARRRWSPSTFRSMPFSRSSWRRLQLLRGAAGLGRALDLEGGHAPPIHRKKAIGIAPETSAHRADALGVSLLRGDPTRRPILSGAFDARSG